MHEKTSMTESLLKDKTFKREWKWGDHMKNKNSIALNSNHKFQYEFMI